jgi:hypothetical protein
MKNNEFIKITKALISYYDEFFEKLEKLNILDFNNNQLIMLRENLEKRKMEYINIINKIAYEMDNNNNQNRIKYSQDMTLFSLYCYGIDFIDDFNETIDNLIKINNKIPNILI